MIFIQSLWITLRLLPLWWICWNWPVLMRFRVPPGGYLLQRQLAAAHWALRQWRIFCAWVVLWGSHYLHWKVACFLRNVIGCNAVMVFSNCAACRDILEPRIFVTNVNDCLVMTLPTLEQISFTGCCAALAGLIIPKYQDWSWIKSLLCFNQYCNWSAEKWSQLINEDFLLSEHHETISFHNLLIFLV